MLKLNNEGISYEESETEEDVHVTAKSRSEYKHRGRVVGSLDRRP